MVREALRGVVRCFLEAAELNQEQRQRVLGGRIAAGKGVGEKCEEPLCLVAGERT
jgi:hypothetical protein